MKLDINQIDAFAKHAFEGNTAAICPLQEWLEDSIMQAIAAENNLSETAFIVPNGNEFDFRWFTPTTEVNLCGHATLAAVWVYFNLLNYSRPEIVYNTRSGKLAVAKVGNLLQMNFPAQKPAPIAVLLKIELAFGIQPLSCLKFVDIIAVLESEAMVLANDTSAAASRQREEAADAPAPAVATSAPAIADNAALADRTASSTAITTRRSNAIVRPAAPATAPGLATLMASDTALQDSVIIALRRALGVREQTVAARRGAFLDEIRIHLETYRGLTNATTLDSVQNRYGVARGELLDSRLPDTIAELVAVLATLLPTQ